MVLCPHCDSDMKKIHEVRESRNCGAHLYEVCIYECPLCYDKYRVVDRFNLVNRRMERME